MKKTIISIIPHLQGGGIERIVTLLSSGLIKEEHYDVHIITLKPFTDGFPYCKKIKVHKLNLSKRSKLGLRLSNKKKSTIIDSYILNNISNSPDLVLCHQESVSKSMSYSNMPNIYSVIHSHISNSRLSTKSGLNKWFCKRRIYNLYKKQKCICVSNGIKNDLEDVFSIMNSHVIYNAIDQEDIYLSSKKSISTIYNNYFIHVGNFTKAKRQDRLVKSYFKSKINRNLLMLGRGSERLDAVQELVFDYHLQHKVKIIEFTNNPYPYIANAKGLILSSDFEGLPMVIIEAISLGIPVISTNCKSGPAEIVGEENHHCLTDLTVDSLSKKMIELDANPDKFIVKLDEKFTLHYAVKQYCDLIK